MAQVMLDVGSFGGASALPILVAQELGHFSERGLEVRRTVTTDSGLLRDGLEAGNLDIVHAAPDNVIAWADDGLAAAAWLAGSNGPISLVAGSAAEVEDLRGRRVGVDSPRSGFVPIMRRLLDEGGLDPDAVELVSLGATRRRFEALREGAIEATMLTLPWSHLATAAGATTLADHMRVAPDLVTSCALSLRAWLEREAAIAAAYADGIDAAVAWLHDPDNRLAAIDLFGGDVGLELDVAASVLATMLRQPGGWPAGSRLLGPELTATWELRADAMGRPQQEPAAYAWRLPTQRPS